MRYLLPILSILTFLGACSSRPTVKSSAGVDKKTIGLLPTEERPDLVELAEFKGVQVTGVTVTKEGRLFANFPRLRKDVPFSVIEIKPDGTHFPYPNETWNDWKGAPTPGHFTSVQSVLADGNSLYVLDTSNPEMKGIVGRPKIYEFDLKDNTLKKTYEFDEKVAPKKAYLNDLRVDDKNHKIYVTDSGLGGIIVLDQKSGEARRFLGKHPSTKSEDVTLTIDEKEFLRPDGKRPHIHSDGIALSPIDQKLYYHALTGYQLYRVPVAVLDSDRPDETQIVKKIEKLGTTPAPDGMIFDKKGNLYMADLERNAISYRTPLGEMKILIQDERLKWPDSFTIDKDNNLIFTDSLVMEAPAGKAVDDKTFKIYKVALPQ